MALAVCANEENPLVAIEFLSQRAVHGMRAQVVGVLEKGLGGFAAFREVFQRSFRRAKNDWWA